ncbi:MAG TPA: DUF11 domain-containing protein [Candidatus Limnocylindrales bacterium]|nr:DUF11 domain-containing protein [Candidatus Limnocylindrales bacterium]
MKGFSCYLKSGLLALAMIVACSRASAQAFGLSVIPSANSLLVSNSLTYTINVTNLTGLVLNDVWVTNSFSAPFQYVTSSASQPLAGVLTNATSVQFDLGPLSIGNIVQVLLTVQPNATGQFTNSVVVAVPTTSYAASTNAVVQVTNVVVLADLGVSMTGPSQAVITNDLMTYGVTVTNLGPNAAPNVILTNTLPPGVIPISLTNQSNGSNFIYNLGTLTNGAFTNLLFTVEPTNAGTLTFSASVGSSGVQDANITNNTASTNITVTNYLSGPLAVTTNSPETYNPQNGLVEQSITVTNSDTNNATAVRVVVAGLTNRLFNAVGTNSGNPFVVYSAALNTNQSVNLLLQYSASAYFAFTNGQLSAFAVPLPNWTPPSATGTSTNLVISRIVELTNGNMLIEFPTTAGQTYTVVYSDNVSFSNATIAPPPIVAPANRTQWIDYGPPTTRSVPTNTARFYRVLQNH